MAGRFVSHLVMTRCFEKLSFLITNSNYNQLSIKNKRFYYGRSSFLFWKIFIRFEVIFMSKIIAISVCDNSRHMSVSPVMDMEKDDWKKVLAGVIDQTKENLEGNPDVVKVDAALYKQLCSTGDGILLDAISEFDISSTLVNGEKGPSAYVWVYSADKHLHDGCGNLVVANFDVDRYPTYPAVEITTPYSTPRHIKKYRKELLSHIETTYKDHQHLKYYEAPCFINYALMIYDPRVKDAAQSIKGRIYATSLQYPLENKLTHKTKDN